MGSQHAASHTSWTDVFPPDRSGSSDDGGLPVQRGSNVSTPLIYLLQIHPSRVQPEARHDSMRNKSAHSTKPDSLKTINTTGGGGMGRTSVREPKNKVIDFKNLRSDLLKYISIV